MNILFLHRAFPGQFQHLIWALNTISNCNVTFITEDTSIEIPGIQKIIYSLSEKKDLKEDSFLERYDYILAHAKAVAKEAKNLQNKGYRPDIIYGFGPAGLNLFMKDIWPDVPLISYCEWFYNFEGADIGFDGRKYSDEKRYELRCKNSHLLIDLYSCDLGISPTNWQKKQFPKDFQDKIKVLHDGICTDILKPDKNAKFFVKDKNIELTSQDEVITYATRGMEPYRGFPQFMEAAKKILDKRQNAHIVIAGYDNAFYGPKLQGESYKENMLKKLEIDMSRVHFVEVLPYDEYIKLLQISSAHIYLTYPFILSWSFLEAMSTGCCIIASNTEPVREVMTDNYNGLLVNFFDVEGLVNKIIYAVDNKEKMQAIRNNARKTVVENYDIKVVLPKYIDLLNNLKTGSIK